jgi:ATP synthase protein I
MREEPGGPDSSFEERLKAARGRRGLDGPTKPDGFDPKGLGSSLIGIGLRVGIELVAALVVAVAIGYGLDWLFGTKPILTAAFVPVGGAAGVWNVWRVFAPKTGQR